MTNPQSGQPADAAYLDPEQPGIIIIGGKPMMEDAKGRYVPVANVKPADKLTDQTVRKIIEFARDLSSQIARFKGHTYDDIGTLLALIAGQYGEEKGGAKGNLSLITFDGRLKVTVKVADQLAFGPELQAAKQLVDACLAEWSDGSRDELVTVVNRAFQVDKEGLINRAELFMLLRVEIKNERWQAAMDAVRDSIRVIGSKKYINFYERDDADGSFRAIPIDLAAA